MHQEGQLGVIQDRGEPLSKEGANGLRLVGGERASEGTHGCGAGKRGGRKLSVNGVVVREGVGGVDKESAGREKVVTLWRHEKVIEQRLAVGVQWRGVAGKHGGVWVYAAGVVQEARGGACEERGEQRPGGEVHYRDVQGREGRVEVAG